MPDEIKLRYALDEEILRDALNKERIRETLDEEIKLVFFDETDSTNVRAAEYAKAVTKIEPTLFIARRQTVGKGRLGRRFVSFDGGIYMSLLMPASELQPTEITARAAVAAALALERVCGLHAGIKWVNDLYANGKKLAGILTEGVFDENGNLRYFIVGMGINVYKNTDLLADLPIATTIEDVISRRVNINEIAAALTCGIAGIGTLSEPLKNYRERCILVGRKVTVHGYDQSYSAECIAVDDDYSLIVKRESDGEAINVFTGEVSVRLT